MSLKRVLHEASRRDRLIVTPRYTPWLQSHADDPLPPWVVQRVSRLLKTPPRVREGTFSASSSGSCLRSQELSFLGAPATVRRDVDWKLMSIYQDGKYRHLRHQGNLLASSIIAEIEYGLDWPKYRAYGTMDGLGFVPADHPQVEWRGEPFGLEIKGVSPFLFPRWSQADLPQESHLRQGHRYFLLYGMRLFVYLYENKGTQELKEWVVTPNPELMAESMQELKDLNKAVKTRTLHERLPSCAIRRGPAWNSCPYAGVGGTCERAKRWIRATDT